MRLPSPPRIPVLSREDKEAKLKEFIAEALAAGHGGEVCVAEISAEISLVARAVDSPVVKAVLAMAGEIAAANRTIRVVVFDADTLHDDSTQSSLFDTAAIEVRALNDQRFASAHEQLSLGYGRVWIGDCMRRDPAKRDAFEMYHTGRDAFCAHARASFAKLWDKAAAPNRVLRTAVPADVLLAGQPADARQPASTRR